MIDYCQQHDIFVEAYAPIAHGKVLKNQIVVDMATAYHVTPAQLCIRNDLHIGTMPLPKTGDPEHMQENTAVDFAISDADMQTLKQVAPIKNYGMMRVMPVLRNK